MTEENFQTMRVNLLKINPKLTPEQIEKYITEARARWAKKEV